MWCTTGIGKLIAIIFQTTPGLFQSFLRSGFGRRAFPLRFSLLYPLGILVIATAVRHFSPHWIVYAPIRVIPPFHSWPEYQALLASEEIGLPRGDSTAFVLFAALFLVIALGHYIRLKIACLRKTDPVNTRFHGDTWLQRLPGLAQIRIRRIQSVVEPLFVFSIGYAFCAVAPAFGPYLMAGGIVLWIEQSAYWRDVKRRELDTRDAYAAAEIEKVHHARAQEFIERSKQAQAGAVSEKTLARVQTNPHALLALTPEETAGVRQVLGADDFGDLVDQLPEDARHEVYSRMPSITAVKPLARPA